MKKIYFLLSLILISIGSFSQQNVQLIINHKLGSSPFALNQTASNNLGNSFTVDRLNYYIAEIKLIHDGGTVTTVPNTWLLVDASQSTSVNLGAFNISNLEGISFAVGVEQSVNHNDPSTYPANHPLAPKSPSMHWGWTAGYRFVAFEGKTGTSMNQIFQVHALGDRNYIPQTINTSGQVNGNNLTIELDADYTQALKNITVSPNLINHGETGESATLLLNFSTDVFSPMTVGLSEEQQVQFQLQPNPASGVTQLIVTPDLVGKIYRLVDVSGKVISNGQLNTVGELPISLDTKGIYFVNIYDNDLLIGRQKLLMQ